VNATSWFQDEGTLLACVREASRRGPRVPTIPGCEGLRELGRGGQGVVYLATQRSTKRRVAVKVLVDGVLASREARRRFEREIDLAASLQHPNIIRVYDSGVTEDGHAYYVMEYVEGTSLEELVRPGITVPRAPVAETLALFVKICGAVSHAHQRGVIHRDLKPSNIRIDTTGEPHVLDFGLAKSALTSPRAASRPSLSMSRQFVGSLPWSSPEQAEGALERVDVRSDVYALGVMLYQLLTGQFPYSVVGTFPAVLNNIRTAPPHPPRGLCREIDEELEAVVLMALAKEPERRYQTAGELARDLERYLRHEPLEAKRDSTWYTVRKSLRRHRLAVGAVCGFVVLAVGVAVTTSVLYGRAVRAERLAEQRRQGVEAEADKVRRTKQFLQGMFGSLEPATTRGRDPRLLQQILQGAVQRVEQELAGEPAVEAPVRATLGRTYLALGDYAAAETNLFGAVRLYRSLADPGRRSGHRPDDLPLEMLQAISDLGQVYHEQSRFTEAEPLAREALEGFRRAAGEEDPSTLAALNNLALLLNSMGDAEQAERLYRQALDAQRRVLGEAHPDTISSKGNLAQLLLDRGSYDEAAPLVEEVLALRRRQLGPNHPDTITSITNAARVAQEQNCLEEAEALYREAVDGSRRVLGDDHPRTLSAISNLAVLCQQRGRVEEAENLLREAIEQQRRTIPDDDPAAALLLNNLARVLQESGRLVEAVPLLRQAHNTVLQKYGPEHPQTLAAMNNLAGVLADLGRRDEALELFRQCLDIRRRTLGAEHPQTLLAGINYGGCLRDAGRLDEALGVFEEVAGAAAGLPADHWLLPYLSGGQGEALTLLKRFEEAEPLLLDSYTAFRSVLGYDHPTTGRAASRLADLYRAWGRPEQAAVYAPTE